MWWYREPSIIDTFVESYDFAGITIIPFCTSGGSDIGNTADNLKALAKDANVLTGKRLASNASEEELGAWAEVII